MSNHKSKEFDRIKQLYFYEEDTKDLTFQNFLNLTEDEKIYLVSRVKNFNDKGVLNGLWKGIYNLYLFLQEIRDFITKYKYFYSEIFCISFN